MADLKGYKVYKNTQFEILTDEGFKDFKGLIVGKNKDRVKLTFTDGISLICTPKHKLMINKNDFVCAKDSSVGDVVYGDKEVKDIEEYSSNDLVYEILDVKDIHRYYVNGILSHQCLIIDEMAFIPDHIMKEFWNSVIPVVSSYRGTKIFCVSTPNGAGNMFHKIYSQAERGESSQWRHERVDWWEIPGRGKKWKKEMQEALAGEGKSFDQEFGNVFLETGQAAVDTDLLNHFRNIAHKPEILMENGAYKIWKQPEPGKLYVIGVDVCEGVGQAASVAQVIDVTDLSDIHQCACYHNNLVDPFHFAEILNKMTNQWGRPYLLIERNNCGGQVIDALQQVHYYPNIVDYTPEKQKYYNKLGIYSHQNAKYKGVINMRYWINSLRSVSLYDIGTIQELETFVKYPNGTWKAKQGEYIYDDRVLALMWALFALEPIITERYFDIISLDERGKPKKIAPINIEPPKYFKLDPIYQNDPNAPLPVFIGNTPGDIGGNDDLNVLLKNGWEFPK